jgi:hypothetical protein
MRHRRGASRQLAPQNGHAASDAGGPRRRTRFPGPPVALCLERHKGPIGSAWRQYALLVLVPITPLPLARSREACTPSRAKDAPTDATLPLALLRTHRNTLQPLQPQCPTRRALAQLVAHRRRGGGAPGRLPNRLSRPLKTYFPHGLHWLQKKAPVICCDCLRR